MKIGQIEGLPIREITCTNFREVKNPYDVIDKEYITMMQTGTFSELYTMQGKWIIWCSFIVKVKAV